MKSLLSVAVAVCLLSLSANRAMAAEAGFIEGRVLDLTTGKPVKGATIQTFPKSQLVRTNEHGRYRIGVRFGKGFIKVMGAKPGFLSNVTQATKPTAVHPKSTANLTLRDIRNVVTEPPLIDPQVRQPEIDKRRPPRERESLSGRVFAKPVRYEYQTHDKDSHDYDRGDYLRILPDAPLIPVAGARVTTVPPTEETYTDLFGVFYIRSGVHPGVRYQVKIEKPGFRLIRPLWTETLVNTESQTVYTMATVALDPRFSISSSLHVAYADLTITSDTFFAGIKYTVDGQDPRGTFNDDSEFRALTYDQPLFITREMTVRAYSFAPAPVEGSRTFSRRIRIQDPGHQYQGRVRIRSAVIEDRESNTTRRGHGRWFPNEGQGKVSSLPDTQVKLFEGRSIGRRREIDWREVATTKVINNTLYPYWNHLTQARVIPEGRIKIVVEDIDPNGIDVVGELETIISQQDLDRGYKIVNFGAVREMIIVTYDPDSQPEKDDLPAAFRAILDKEKRRKEIQGK